MKMEINTEMINTMSIEQMETWIKNAEDSIKEKERNIRRVKRAITNRKRQIYQTFMEIFPDPIITWEFEGYKGFYIRINGLVIKALYAKDAVNFTVSFVEESEVISKGVIETVNSKNTDIKMHIEYGDLEMVYHMFRNRDFNAMRSIA